MTSYKYYTASEANADYDRYLVKDNDYLLENVCFFIKNSVREGLRSMAYKFDSPETNSKVIYVKEKLEKSGFICRFAIEHYDKNWNLLQNNPNETWLIITF